MAKKGKLRMREWLIENLDAGRFKDTLEWYRGDGSSEGELFGELGRRRLFRIKWLHASTGHYTENDSDLFREWCLHTGKLKASGDSSKRWKANFRCALNSLPDVTPVIELTVRKGKNAYRVFEILDEKLPEKVAKKRESNQRCSSKKPKKRKFARTETSDETIQRKRASVVRAIKQQPQPQPQPQPQQRPTGRDVSALASTAVGYSLLDSINCSGSNGSSTRSSSIYSDLPSTVEDMNNNDEKEEVEEEIVFDTMIESSSEAATTAADNFDGCDAFDMEHNRFADYGHDTNSGSSTLSSAADLADDQTEELLSDLASVIPLPLCDGSSDFRSNRNVIVRRNILITPGGGMLACQMEDVSV